MQGMTAVPWFRERCLWEEKEAGAGKLGPGWAAGSLFGHAPILKFSSVYRFECLNIPETELLSLH